MNHISLLKGTAKWANGTWWGQKDIHCLDCTTAIFGWNRSQTVPRQQRHSLMPRLHPRGEKKGSGYTTSRPTLEGRNQHIVSDHVLTYAIYGILTMPHGPHCGTYYSNCAVIGHFTCQMAVSLGRAGCRIVTRPLGGWGLGKRQPRHGNDAVRVSRT